MSIQAVAWVLEQYVPDQGAKLVLISLANAHNAKSRRCFPSIEQISVEASCSRATVKRKILWLADNGWIDVKSEWDQTGRQLANSYSIRFDRGAQSEPGEGFNLNHRGLNCEPGEGFTAEPPGGLNCEPPLKVPEEIPEEVTGISIDQTSRQKRVTDKVSAPPSQEIEREFDGVFWPVYPRKAGKGQALKAYRSARKKTGCDVIMAGLVRYVEQRKGQDQQYTKHPATWLNGECWLDEPPKPIAAKNWRDDPIYAAVL